MPTNNPWLNPYQRSFNSIKEQLRISLQENVSEITDYSEGNIFMIILSIYAGIAEVIHYYIDNMARETFFSSARRYSSLYKHAKLVDYHIKSAVPASVDLTLYTLNGQDLPSSITIPTGTVFNSTDGKSWVVTAQNGIYWDKNLYPRSIKVPVVQKETIGESESIYFGQIISQEAIVISVIGIPEGRYYAEGSMVLTIDDEPWELVDTFAYSGPDSKHYKVELDSDLTPTIVFGDGTYGKKPDLGGQVYGYFQVTYGTNGNIPEGSFNSMPNIPGANTSNIGVTNYHAASGGSNYETFSMLKEHVPLSVKTLGVAITKEDFEATAKLLPGVNKAYAEYICGKRVRLYITPDNGEIEASDALINSVSDKLNSVKVITTTISVLPVHRAIIYIDATIYGKKSFHSTDIKNQIVQALYGSYGYDNADIGRAVRVSDVYSLLDNLSMIDYLNLNKLYVAPSPILLSSEGSGVISPELIITTLNQISYKAENDFEDVYIEMLSATTYELEIQGYTFQGTIGTALHVQTQEIDFYITFGTSTSTYNTGDRYWMYIGRMNTNIEARSYGEAYGDENTSSSYRAIPIFLERSDTLILDIHESV